MKKLLSLLLVLTFIVMIGSVCFAAAGDPIINDPEVPGAPVETVEGNTYDEQPTSITDEGIPEGSKDSIPDEVIPQGAALPKTGGIPAEAFYVAGALFIVAALVISKKKAKVATKN